MDGLIAFSRTAVSDSLSASGVLDLVD